MANDKTRSKRGPELERVKYCGIGLPDMDRAVAAIEGRQRAFVVWVGRGGEQFDVMTVASSSMWSTVLLANTFNMGSKENNFRRN
jgi:hypothetical protein